MVQNREGRRLEQQVLAWREANAGRRQIAPALAPVLSKSLPPAAAGDLIGRIEVPRIGLSAIVMEGIGSKTLRHAVGHIPGMALPGQQGNVGIAGHRDSFFRPLRNVLKGDIITLTTSNDAYRYRVVSAKVVGPDDVAVLDRGLDDVLTLVTCYPFYFVGPAPDRFIVRAERIAQAQ